MFAGFRISFVGSDSKEAKNKKWMVVVLYVLTHLSGLHMGCVAIEKYARLASFVSDSSAMTTVVAFASPN